MRTFNVVCVCAPLIVAAVNVRAADTPQLKAGLWQFERSIEGDTNTKPVNLSSKRCTDPTQLFSQPARLPGCTISAMTRNGNSYSFTADCTIAGTAMASKTVVAVENDGAYTQTVESHGGGHATKEVLVAKRVGDCAH